MTIVVLALGFVNSDWLALINGCKQLREWTPIHNYQYAID